MSSFMSHFEGPDEHEQASLRECRLVPEPVMLLIFTDEVEDVSLHYESDDSIRSYLVCPGEGCPLCFLGSPPQAQILLPVFNVEAQAVQVLRVSKKRGPDSLGGNLVPHLNDPHISNKLLTLSRQSYRYRVESRELAENASRGTEAIAAFKTAFEAGLKLSSAFPQLGPSEIADIERVRRKLEAIGGFPQVVAQEEK